MMKKSPRFCWNLAIEATTSIIGKHLALFSATVFGSLIFCILDQGPQTGASQTTLRSLVPRSMPTMVMCGYYLAL